MGWLFNKFSINYFEEKPMKIDAAKFGLACAITFAVLWVVCSLLVMVMPNGMMQMSGHMIHGDVSGFMSWNMNMHGVLMGLIGWSISAGISGWLIAVIYNKLM
jgi:hypothetical protein